MPGCCQGVKGMRLNKGGGGGVGNGEVTCVEKGARQYSEASLQVGSRGSMGSRVRGYTGKRLGRVSSTGGRGVGVGDGEVKCVGRGA